MNSDIIINKMATNFRRKRIFKRKRRFTRRRFNRRRRGVSVKRVVRSMAEKKLFSTTTST